LRGEPTLGTWSYDRKDWGPQEDRESTAAIRTAYDGGIRKFDTAYAYGNGHSENLLARSLGKRLRECFVASKLGPKGTEANFYRGIEASLKRLKTDALDLYYLHWPSSRIDLRPSLDALAAARERGLVRYIGVCNTPPGLLAELHAHIPLDAVQDGYNLLWRKPEGVIDFCRKRGIAFEAYSPLAQGLLVKPAPGPDDFDPGDKRRDLVFFSPSLLPAVHRAIEEVRRIAASWNVTPQTAAYGWLTAREEVNSVILGYRSELQVRKGLEAYSASLPPGAIRQLDRAGETLSEVIDSEIPGYGNFFGYSP
jgi:aryl-alcohol dehydrogenase-like predicted oxidoreductase